MVSTASPMHFSETYKRESTANPSWIKFFQSEGFSQKQINKYLQDCDYADLIMVPSRFVFRDISRFIDSEKIEMLHLGHDVLSLGIDPSFNRISKDRMENFKIIFVGQLSQRKGLSYLIEGFLKANIPTSSTLSLVGTSVLGSAKYVARNYPTERIKLIGHVNRNELGPLLLNHDLFLMPSLIEGFCLSAVEALATGIPVAVTNVVLDDILQDQVNGYLLEKYSTDSVAKILEKVFKDWTDAINVGLKGKELAKDFTWEIYAKEFLTALLKVAN